MSLKGYVHKYLFHSAVRGGYILENNLCSVLYPSTLLPFIMQNHFLKWYEYIFRSFLTLGEDINVVNEMFVHVIVANVRKQSDWIVQSYGAEGIKSTMPGFRSYFWDCVLGPLTLIWVWFGAGSGTIQSQIHQLLLFALHQDQASWKFTLVLNKLWGLRYLKNV